MYHQSSFCTLKQFEYKSTLQKLRTIFLKSSSINSAVPDLACFEQTVSVGSLLLQLGLHHGDLFLGVSHLLLLVVQPLLDLADLRLKVIHLWLQGYPLPLGFLLLVHGFLDDLSGTRRSHCYKSITKVRRKSQFNSSTSVSSINQKQNSLPFYFFSVYWIMNSIQY